MNQRDLELLSSYLDGQLSPSDSTRLEARLKTDRQLVSVLNDLRATRSLLRKLPQRRAPRNFTLTRKMVGQNPPLPKSYPFFRLATAFATLLLVFSFGLNSFSRFATTYPYGFGGMGGGGGADQSMESSAAAAPMAATEAPAFAEPALTEVPAEPFSNLAPMATQIPTEAADAARIEDTPASKSSGVDNVNGLNQAPVESEPQRPALISSAWQIGLAVVALLSFLLMVLLRQLALRHWK